VNFDHAANLSDSLRYEVSLGSRQNRDGVTGLRLWWWVGAILDLLLLLPAFYMAIAAVDIAARNPDSPFAVAVAALFFVLPVFCIAAPLAAWRAHSRARPSIQIAALFAAPVVYAAFLTVFLFNA